MKKEFIVKDGELIIKKSLSEKIPLDQVPESPYPNQGLSTKQIFSICIALLLVGFVIALGVSPALRLAVAEILFGLGGGEEDLSQSLIYKDGVTYTQSSKTICKIIEDRSVCNLMLYSGVMFTQNSSKDWVNPSEVLSVTKSHDDITFHYKGIKGEYNITFEVGVIYNNNYYSGQEIKTLQPDIEINIPIKKYSTEFKYAMNLSNIKLDKSKLQNITLTYKTHSGFNLADLKISRGRYIIKDFVSLGFGDLKRFGFAVEINKNEKRIYIGNLTDKFNGNELYLDPTLNLNIANTDNLEDGYGNKANTFNSYGADDNFWVNADNGNTFIQRAYLKFNISLIPSGQTIDLTKLYVYKLAKTNAMNLSAYHVYDRKWVEGPTAGAAQYPILSFSSQPCGVAFDNVSCNTGAALDTIYSNENINVWDNFTVTSAVAWEYAAGNFNVSVVLKPVLELVTSGRKYASKEHATVGARPALNVTYSVLVIPSVENIFPKNSTQAYAKYVNFTYNASDADSVINNCSLYLKHSYAGTWERNKTTDVDPVIENINNTFNLTLPYENIYWKVGCYADDAVQFNSSEFNYTRLITRPIIYNVFPKNQSTTTTRNMNLTYNVTIAYGSIDSCWLWLNDTQLNQTDSSITSIINQSFNITTSAAHRWAWKIECNDTENVKGNSSTWEFILNNPPTTPTIISPANNTITPRISAANSTVLNCSDSTDIEGDTINYEFYGGTSKSSLSLLTNTTQDWYNWTGLRPNNYHWSCRANDNRDNSYFTQNRTFTLFDFYANCSAITNSTTAHAFNITFASENGTRLFNVDTSQSFNVWGSDSSIYSTLTTGSITAKKDVYHCISPVNATITSDITISYEKTGWNLRHWNQDDYAIDDITDDIILYLLPTGEGIYVTFQVVNVAGQPIENVFFTAERQISGTWTTLFSQLTDAAGSTTPFLDPDYSHRFTFVKAGYDTYTTILTPTQSSYTITLGEVVVTNETVYSRGISYTILPSDDTLNNQTIYNFSFDISSSYHALISAGFILTNSSNHTLASVSCSVDVGCISSINMNVENNDSIIMHYYWIIDSTKSGGTRSWYVQSIYEGSYSIMSIFRSAQNLGSGFNDFTRAIISFIIILSIVGTACLKFELHTYSETSILILIAILATLLDYVQFLPQIPEAIPHFIPVILWLIPIGYFIYELKR